MQIVDGGHDVDHSDDDDRGYEMDLRWNKREHFKSWIEKKPVEVVDVCCQVEQQEEQGEHNYLQMLTMTDHINAFAMKCQQ